MFQMRPWSLASPLLFFLFAYYRLWYNMCLLPSKLENNPVSRYFICTKSQNCRTFPNCDRNYSFRKEGIDQYLYFFSPKSYLAWRFCRRAIELINLVQTSVSVFIITICLQFFFSSFLSRDEALKLIEDGWSEHGNGAKSVTYQQVVHSFCDQDL